MNKHKSTETFRTLSILSGALSKRKADLMKGCSDEAIETALLLISAIRGSDIEEPTVIPLFDEGIQLEWKMPGHELIITILPDGSVEFPVTKAEDSAMRN